MSKTPLKTLIRSALRRIWMYSELQTNAKNAARVARGVYRCAHCTKLVGPKLIKVDHIIKVTPNGFDPDANPRQWGELIERLLYVKPSGLQALCKTCHDTKTKEEKNEAKQNIKKKTRKQKAKRPNRVRAPRNR